MKLIFFVSAVSASFLNLISHGTSTAVHLLILKGSMICRNASGSMEDGADWSKISINLAVLVVIVIKLFYVI